MRIRQESITLPSGARRARAMIWPSAGLIERAIVQEGYATMRVRHYDLDEAVLAMPAAEPPLEAPRIERETGFRPLMAGWWRTQFENAPVEISDRIVLLTPRGDAFKAVSTRLH